jgi:CshA-type fibril repeat protein
VLSGVAGLALLGAAIVVPASSVVAAPTVTTYALASASHPDSGVFDAAGNFYTANQSSGTISKITPNGVITAVWVTLPTGAGPEGIAIDRDGNLYTSNPGLDTVSKITPSGIETPAWGALASGSHAEAIVVNSAGNVFVAQAGDYSIAEFDPSGDPLETFPLNGAPYALAFDWSGNLYSSNTSYDTISKLTPGGVLTDSWAALAPGSMTTGLAFDSSGNLYAANRNLSTISKVTPAGTVTSAWATLPSGSGAYAIAVDSADTVYATTLFAHGVAKITPAGVVTQSWAPLAAGATPTSIVFNGGDQAYITNVSGNTVTVIDDSVPNWITLVAGSGAFGSDPPAAGMATTTALGYPQGLAYDSYGNLYIADANTYVVLRVTPEGSQSVFAGGGNESAVGLSTPTSATDLGLSSPSGVAVDSSGNVYIADSGDGLVLKVDGSGDATIFAGTGARVSRPTHGPATTMDLISPSGLDVDAHDNLYIADTGNSMIEEVDHLTGMLTVIAGDGSPNNWSPGPATSSHLRYPNAVAVGPAGDVYIADSGNNLVEKVDHSTGLLSRFAGTGGAGAFPVNGPAADAGIEYPFGVAVNGAGDVYIASLSAAAVVKVSAAGQLRVLAGDGTTSLTLGVLALSAGAGGPAAITLDPGGYPVVGDRSNSYVYRIAPAGAPSAPIALTAVQAAAAGSGDLSFTAPLYTNESAITGYEASVNAGPWATLVTHGTGALTARVSGLVGPGTYPVRVRAVNGVGPGSASGSANLVLTLDNSPLLRAPTGPTAIAGESSVIASWTPPSPSVGVIGYTVTAVPGPATCSTSSPTDTSCVLGAVAGTPVSFTVLARSATAHSVPSASSNSVTPTAPTVPPAAPSSAPVTLTTDQGQIGLASPGQDITVIGTGFAPFSTASVIIYSTPTNLGSTTTDASGSFSLPVTVPGNLAVGAHTFLASGVDATGSARMMALPITVAPTEAGGTGGGPGTGTGTLPIPHGGTITLLDGAGLPATVVTVPQGTYTLDAVTGTISFVPIAGFVGTATPVSYRITDAIGTVITGSYTASVTAPAPPGPPAGKPTVKLPARIVASTGSHGSASLPCLISRGAIARCTVTVTAVVSRRAVVVGRGAVTTTSRQSLRKVTVKIALSALGRSLTARPGGGRFTFTAVVLQRGRSGSNVARGTTSVVAKTFRLARSIRFGTDAHAVGKSDASYLRGVRSKLTGTRAITCVGHADSRGGSRAALTLGARRAKAACAILASGRRFTVHIVSRGDRAPIGRNNTAAGRARNRRVDITILN